MTATAPGQPTPLVVAVDARSLKRPGIGFYVVVKAMLAELVENGCSVVLVIDEAGDLLRLRREYNQAEVVCLPKTTWLWWEQVQVARWLFRRRPDIWVAPTNYGVPLVRPRGTLCLLVVHDLIPLLFPRTYLTPRPLWAAMYLISASISIFSAHHIVAVSGRTANDLHRFSRRRATVMYPPIPRRVAGPSRPSPVGQPYVIYNGGFDSRKNVPQLLDAFSTFRGTAEGAGSLLVVLGDRQDIADAMLREWGLTEASLVTGFVDEQEKWDYLVNAVAVLYPSSYEGFGLVATDAFAAGVPVVSGTGGALREVGGDAAIFVDPMSVGSIVRGLRFACDPAVRARQVANGYKQLEALRERSEGYALLVASLWQARSGQGHRRAGRISR